MRCEVVAGELLELLVWGAVGVDQATLFLRA